MKNWKFGIAGGVAVLGSMLAVSHAFAADPIKIGVVLPTSGGLASYGLTMIDGVKLAVQEINDAGGINGRQLEYVARDSQTNPNVASAAAKELISKEGVKAIIGAVSSGVTLAVSEVAKQEKVVLFAPAARAKSITGEKLHKYVFQGIKTTDDEARDLANILKDQGAKKVCMTGYDYAYTTDLFEAMKSELGNIPITGEFLVKLGTNDFSTLISQLQANECDAVLGALFSGGFVAFAKQAKPFGFFESKKVVWAASVASTEVTTQLKQDYPEGMWAGAFDFWYYDGSEAHKKFQDGIAKIEGTKETGMYALNGYRAMYFIAEAMKKAGSDDPDAVVAALEGLTIETPLGPVTMDAKTHRVDAAEFYGPVVTVAGSDVKRMSPINLVK
ncbi:MAG: ABC transporter substrate-binding protein [Rhodobiaceae bacterium]|nr:ABC transporter substrate-binding protein [Rhodobiaceae bacterium]